MKWFKKGEIAIYAVALMLVAAGYFNYTTFNNQTLETYSEDVNQIDSQYANTGDAVLVSNNEVENQDKNETEEKEEVANQDISNEEKDTKEDDSETENTNSEPVKENNDDYYASSKLERDKMYAEMVSNYEKIINNANASEAQKSIATQEISKINNTKNAIMICENLIKTKGFDNCVILVNDSSVNVVVKIEGGLKTEAVAKIQNIVSREMSCDIQNIHISEK